MLAEPSPLARPVFSANTDWVRALQRTAAITPESQRTLSVAIAEAAQNNSASAALVGEHEILTYSQLSQGADLYARWGLEQGLVKGDRVALLMTNRPDYAAVWIGLSRIGVVTALLNTQLLGAGLAHGLALAEAKHLIVGAEHVQVLDEIAFTGRCWTHGIDRKPHSRIDHAIEACCSRPLEACEIDWGVTLQDDALLIYTSGTTGLPKAARVSHYRVMMWSEWFAGIVDATPDDRLFNCLPMYHSIGGVVAVGAILVAGASVIVREGFSARRFWPDVTASGATIFQYIGELCRYLLVDPPNVGVAHKLRLCIGNGLRADVWQRFAETFEIPRIIEFYAATEGSFSLFNLEGRPGAIGRVPRFIAHRSPVALVDFDQEAEQPVRDAQGLCRRCRSGEVGEAIGLIAREPSALSTRFEGYTSEIETRRKILRDVFEPGDMWFRTGDLMRQDASGFFYFVDRIGETFRWKGENVSTSEVAAALCACDDILDAAVYGVAVPHADGRAGMAALVATDDLDLGRLRAQLASRLPRFARPVFLRIRKAMALTGTFKLKKQDLIGEGYDPAIVGDTLYLDDPREEAFAAIDTIRHAAIVSERLRL